MKDLEPNQRHNKIKITRLAFLFAAFSIACIGHSLPLEGAAPQAALIDAYFALVASEDIPGELTIGGEKYSISGVGEFSNCHLVRLQRPCIDRMPVRRSYLVPNQEGEEACLSFLLGWNNPLDFNCDKEEPFTKLLTVSKETNYWGDSLLFFLEKESSEHLPSNDIPIGTLYYQQQGDEYYLAAAKAEENKAYPLMEFYDRINAAIIEDALEEGEISLETLRSLSHEKKMEMRSRSRVLRDQIQTEEAWPPEIVEFCRDKYGSQPWDLDEYNFFDGTTNKRVLRVDYNEFLKISPDVADVVWRIAFTKEYGDPDAIDLGKVLDHLSKFSRVTHITFGEYFGAPEVTDPSHTQFTINSDTLTHLEIYGLQSIETFNLPKSLQSLRIKNCEKIKSISNLADITDIWIESCAELNTINLPVSTTQVRIDSCKKIETIDLPKNIRVLQITNSVATENNLLELDLSSMIELKSLCLRNSYEQISTLKLPAGLREISIEGCEELENITGMEELKNLQSLTISKCPKLQGSSEELDLSTMLELESLCLRDACSGIKALRLPAELKEITIEGCEELESMTSIQDLRKLESLTISKCPKLQSGSEELDLSSRRHLTNVELRDSHKQIKRLKLPAGLREITIEGCEELESITDMQGLKEVRSLTISKCPKLQGSSEELDLSIMLELKSLCLRNSYEQISTLKLPPGLREITIEGCEGLENITGMEELKNLQSLTISKCPKLQGSSEELDLSTMTSLERLSLRDAYKGIKTLKLPAELRGIAIEDCSELESITGMEELERLGSITVSHCNKVRTLALPCHVRSVYGGIAINVSHSENLKSIANLSQDKSISKLNIHGCTSFDISTLSGLARSLYSLTTQDGSECWGLRLTNYLNGIVPSKSSTPQACSGVREEAEDSSSDDDDSSDAGDSSSDESSEEESTEED